MTLHMDAMGHAFDIPAFRAFLDTLRLPLAQQGLGKPPAALFIWPGSITVVGHVTELEWSVHQKAPSGKWLVCDAQLTIEVDEPATRKHGGK